MEIAKRNNLLPDNVSDLQKFILIGNEQIKAHKAKIRAIDKTEMGYAAKQAALADGQTMADLLLDAIARLGELIKLIKPIYVGSSGGTHVKRGSPPKQKKSLPPAISKKESHIARTISNNPDVVERVKITAKEKGELATSRDVLREVKKEKQKEYFETLEGFDRPFDGKYDVIVIDPPWKMSKIDRDITPEQTGLDYPTMTEAELSAIPLPMETDCHVFLWTTHKFLPVALRLVDGWSLKYTLTFVWHKNGGFQPFNLPQYNCEFIIYARNGSPKFRDTKDFFTCFDAPRTGHSQKPEEFYNVIRRVTAGRRVDIFGRRDIEGFESWGNEIGNT